MSRTDLKFRNQSIYLSEEIYFYLKLRTKAFLHGSEAAMTIDEWCNNYLRDKLTTDDPDLVLLWEEFQKAKQDAKANYQALEMKAIERLRE